MLLLTINSEEKPTDSVPVPNSYDFEGSVSTERTDEEASNALKIFRRKLAIPDGYNFSPEHKDILIKYVKSVHLNIKWYHDAKKKQMAEVKLYTIGSLTLLLITPLIVFIGGFLFVGEGDIKIPAEVIL